MKNNKEYDIIVYRALKYKNNETYKINLKNLLNKQDFRKYFLNNVKKSSFLAQILPLILFLVISLISFSALILNRNNPKFQGFIKNDNLIIAICCFGVLFLIISLLLFFQRVIFKTKVINIDNGSNVGFYNISQNKYEEILELTKSEI